MTPREREAAQAYWASRKRLWRGVTVGAALVTMIGAPIVLGGLLHLFAGDRHGGGEATLLVGSMLVGMSLAVWWLVRRQARLIEDDLALGTKLVADGVVDSRGCNCKRGDCVYSIRVRVPPHQALGYFAVPERVFQGLAEGDTVRCAYTPSAKILLSLSSATVTYAIGDPLA